MRQKKPTNYIIRNKAEYVNKIGLIKIHIYQWLVWYVDVFFLKSSRQSKFASYKRVFHSVLNGKSWTTANVVCGEQKLDSFALSCEAIFKFAKKYKTNSLNDAVRTRWQGSRDKNNIRWHHQQKWTQPKPMGGGSVVPGFMYNGFESQLSVLLSWVRRRHLHPPIQCIVCLFGQPYNRRIQKLFCKN